MLFDGRVAAAETARIAAAAPDRRAGGVGDRRTADRVAQALDDGGFVVKRQSFSHADKRLVNVIGRRAGRSRHQVVVVANRDAAVVPEATGSAADTAALIELARVLEGRATRKTLVLVSLDGSNLGQVGARELLSELPQPELVDAVLAVSDLASPSRRGSLVQAWSTDDRRAGIGLQRTVADSIRRELDFGGGGPSTLGQLARLSFPIGIGPQSVLLEQGYDAVRISGSGELPPDGNGPVDSIDEDTLGALGRATLRTITALDRGPRPEHGPESYVTAVSQVMPGWVLSLLAVALLLPALVAAVDAFARARRQRVEVLAWLRWVAAWVAPFLAGLAIAELLALVGATPAAATGACRAGRAAARRGGAGRARRSGRRDGAGAAAGALPRSPARPGAGTAAGARRRGRAGGGGERGGGGAVAGQPLRRTARRASGPPVAAGPALRRSTAAAGARVMLGAGALPALLVALYYLVALSMDPLSGAWYLLLLVTGHSVGLLTALVGCVMLGALCASIELVYRSPAERAEPPKTTGPGALGPGFALRR